VIHIFIGLARIGYGNASIYYRPENAR
jgi:hypothetical protein